MHASHSRINVAVLQVVFRGNFHGASGLVALKNMFGDSSRFVNCTFDNNRGYGPVVKMSNVVFGGFIDSSFTDNQLVRCEEYANYPGMPAPVLVPQRNISMLGEFVDIDLDLRNMQDGVRLDTSDWGYQCVNEAESGTVEADWLLPVESW